jgi:4-carboxymuconolactone decarboxylase
MNGFCGTSFCGKSMSDGGAMSRISLVSIIIAAGSIAYVAGQQVQRASAIRIAPIEERDLTEAQREMLGSYAAQPGRTQQLFRICVRAPEMCQAWVGVTRSFGQLSMSPHDRELVILRTSWLCKNEYTWANHVPAAKRVGLSDEDILRIAKGPAGWQGFDKMLLEATDALHTDQFVPDATWKALSARYGDPQLEELVFMVGQYTFAAMWARSAGLPLEPGVTGFPK